MSLRPKLIAAADYPVVTKPSLAYEEDLYISPNPSLELGRFDIAGMDSGTWSPNAANLALLATTPMEVLAMLESHVVDAGANIVVTITGTDQDGGAYTGVSTFKAPGYSRESGFLFPVNWATEAIPTTPGLKLKTITSVAVTADAKAALTGLSLFALPAIDTFKLVALKVSLDYDDKTPESVSIQVGRDKSGYVKPGEIPEGNISIKTNNLTNADGLSRYRGMRVTGLIKETKEKKLVTTHTYFLGLIMGAPKRSVGQSAEVITLSSEGKYEDVCVMVAQT